MKTKILLLFILIMLCVGTSAFAMTQDQFLEYVDYAINNLPTSNNRQRVAFMALKQRGWFENYFFPNYDSYLSKANTIRCNGGSSASTIDSPSISFGIYFYKAKDSTIFYYNSSDSISFSELDILDNNYQCYYVNFTILSTGTTNIGTNGYQNPTNIPFTSGFDNYRAPCSFVNTLNKQIMINSSGTSVTSHSYYFKDFVFTPEVPLPTWSFTKYNNLKLNYSVNEMPLGTFSGDVNPSELNYIWVDYTTQQTIYNSFDYTGMYPSIYNRGMGLFIYNRLLKDHEYDLYIYKDNEDTQQFHYTYIYTSGDTGWNGQDTTNNIIDNNNKQYDDNTKQPNLNDYKVSGDSIISSLGVTFSGDPYDNIWFMLINGFSESLTSDNSLRQWTLSLSGNTNYIIDLDVIHNSIPDAVRTILTLVSSAFLTIKMLKWVKIISDLVSSGNIDEVLEDNSEERHN